MSGTLLSLILLAAVLHAAWNFFAKRAGGSVTVIWLGAVISTIVTLPVALILQFGKPVARDGMALACASGLVHTVYWWALARMYRYGDISLAYPIARGSGVLWTAIGAHFLVREPFSPAGVAGVAAVVAGGIALGYQRRGGPIRARAILLSLLTGAAITGYSLIDDRGAERMDPPVYMVVETGVGAILLGAFGYRRLRRLAVRVYQRYWKTAWIIGIGSPVTYIIILFAYANGPVGYIVAVREFSVVIAALLGVVFLKERLTPARTIGIAFVVAGMVLLKMA